jgi:hypothetical protein
MHKRSGSMRHGVGRVSSSSRILGDGYAIHGVGDLRQEECK